MTDKQSICRFFADRAFTGVDKQMLEPYRPFQSSIRNLCGRCVKVKSVNLPKGYADLTGLAKCSCCGAVGNCIDPDVSLFYANAKIDPHLIYARALPVLRQPLHGPARNLEVIATIIADFAEA